MFKEWFGDTSFYATIGLLMFFAIFVGIVFWTLAYPKKRVKQWSELPLEENK